MTPRAVSAAFWTSPIATRWAAPASWGIRSRYDGQLRDVRVYINQPTLTYRSETTLSLFFREDFNPPTELTDPFDISRKGVVDSAAAEAAKQVRLDLWLQVRARAYGDADTDGRPSMRL